jgi:hypothetical protein
MRIELPILSYATAGVANGILPVERVCPLPEPGLHPRKARLPGLASAMAELTLKGRRFPSEGSILFGTALGCLTETEAFVENLILHDETAPMPRAFSSSVHNTIASRLAIALNARGENVTFVHAEVSLMQAFSAAGLLRRREERAMLLAGAADEGTRYVSKAKTACREGPEEKPGEGGAIFLCGDPVRGERPLAVARDVIFGRFRDLASWISRRVPPDAGIEATLIAVARSRTQPPPHLDVLGRPVPVSAWIEDHPSAAASSLALAVGVLSGEVDPHALSLAASPRRMAILATSRFGDAGLIVVEKCP